MALLLSSYKFVFGVIRKVFIFTLTQQSNAIIPHFSDFFKCRIFHAEKFHSHVTKFFVHLRRIVWTPGTVLELDKVPSSLRHQIALGLTIYQHKVHHITLYKLIAYNSINLCTRKTNAGYTLLSVYNNTDGLKQLEDFLNNNQ